MSEKKLYSVSDAENLDISEVHNLYKQYISKSQVELIGSFGFGNDLVDYAEGSYIYLNNGKKIIDFNEIPEELEKNFLESYKLS